MRAFDIDREILKLIGNAVLDQATLNQLAHLTHVRARSMKIPSLEEHLRKKAGQNAERPASFKSRHSHTFGL